MDEFSGLAFSIRSQPNAANLVVLEGKLLTKQLVYLSNQFLLATTYVAHRGVLECNPCGHQSTARHTLFPLSIRVMYLEFN